MNKSIYQIQKIDTFNEDYIIYISLFQGVI